MGSFSNTANVFAQSSDPGAVGAGALWSDTGSNLTYRRNDADTAWERIDGLFIQTTEPTTWSDGDLWVDISQDPPVVKFNDNGTATLTAPPITKTIQTDTLSSTATTTSTTFVDSGLTLTLANIAGGKATITATMSVYTFSAGSVVVQLLKGASEVIDVQLASTVNGTEYHGITLTGMVDLDGEVVKVRFKLSGGVQAYIYYDSNNSIPKLQILEISDG